MMHRLWLIFTQAVTVTVAALFVVGTLKPEWLGGRPGGASVITLRFSLSMGLDVAEQQVQAAINAASSLLPSDLPAPPTYSKVNPADAPILTLAISSPSLPITRIHDLVESRLAMKISQVAGVGLVSIAGGRRPAVRVQVNPTALAAYGLARLLSPRRRVAVVGRWNADRTRLVALRIHVEA